MSEQPEPDSTAAEPDSLDAGLAAAFGPDSGPPLPANGSVAQALGAAPVQLREPDTEPADPVVRPYSDAVPAQPPPRLQIHGEIARGGMGAILKGRDTDLGRDLAVKVLLETHVGKPELVRRFVEEAQIAGQLQHPGIIPVYELGQFADQRPYFTMKLVKGQTLAALLAARHDPAADRPKFVGIFAQVCQTLAYTHARGVLHRDLKSANIMVGDFGEVQVMDWGLAKVLKMGNGADEQHAHTHRTVSFIRTPPSRGSDTSECGSSTQAGSVLGTPAYMAPEQARGEVDLVDARADVFGLGALLCQILTGQPPFTGPKAEALRKAQTAQLDDSWRRLDGCGADTDLIVLARRCLAAEPWDRPRDASEVAAAVTAYQHSVAERLRQTELAHAAEVARTEEAQATAAQERKAREAAQARAVAERQARRVTLGLTAAVLALVTVGAVGGLWVQRQGAERAAAAARQREAVETALDKVGALEQQGRWAEARTVLEQTRDRLGEAGPEDLRQRVEQASAELALVDRLEAIRLKRSTLVEGRFDTRGAEGAYASAFREAGLGDEGEEAATVAARVRDSAVRDHLVAALDDWAAVTNDGKRRAWLLEVARGADPDAWRDRFRDPQVWRDRAGLESLAKELLDDKKQLARQTRQLLEALGVALASTQADAVPLLTAAQACHPDDFWLNFELGNALYAAKKWDEAVSFYRGAVAARPSAVAVHNNLGISLREKQQLDAAIQEYRTAIALDSKFAMPRNNLGNALVDKQQLDAAIQEYRTAITLDRKSATPHNGLGNALYAKKQLDRAIQEYRTAIAFDPKYAQPHNGLGNALADKQQLDAAIQEYRTAIDLDPKYAAPHNNLGNVLRDQQQLDAAIQEYRTAIALDPKYAAPHNGLGSALADKQQLDAAIQEYRTAIALDPTFAAPHNNLGVALKDQQQLDAAIQEYRTAIALDPTFAMAHNNLGNALKARQQLDASIQEYRTAIALDPKLALPHNGLGNALKARQQLDAAIQEFGKAIALDPKFAAAHNNLGNALRDKQQLDAAIQEYRTAIDLDPKYAEPHYNLGIALYDKQELDAAILEYRRAMALDPKHALSHNGLGNALAAKQQLEAAIEEYRRAIELDPKLASPHYNLGNALADKQQLDAAIQEYRTAIALDPTFAAPHYNLGIALYDKQQLDAAIEEYRRAIALDPKYAKPLGALGATLLQLGRLAEARDSTRRYLELLPPDHPSRQRATRQLQECEQFLALEPKLPAILEGKEKPANDTERLALASLCQQPYKKLYAASFRFYAEAFAHDAKLADDMRQQHRYNAACAAALAGCGHDKDADSLAEQERARLRQQAIAWLRADLAYWSKQSASDKPSDLARLQNALLHWQQDPDLAGLRGTEALKKLPPEEREACAKLWAAVAGLLKQGQEQPKKPM
jgi:tetratricopeptide (TPR) repeat protein